MWWALGAAGVASLLSLVFGFSARRAAKRIGELQADLADCQQRLVDQQELMELLAAPDPTLPELQDAVAASIAAAGGRLSEVEQAAVDRILRPGTARPAGGSDGG